MRFYLQTEDGVATTGENGHVKIWQTRTGEPLGEPIVHEQALLHAAWHPSGDYLAVVDGEGQLIFCDLTRDPPTKTVMPAAGVVERVRFLPDPDQFLVTRPNDTVEVFNCSMAAISLSSRFSMPHRKIRNFSNRMVDGDLDLPRVSANGRWLVTHVGEKLAIWDILGDHPVREGRSSWPIMDLAIDRDGTKLFSTSRHVISQEWALNETSVVPAFDTTFARQTWALALHPNGTEQVIEAGLGVLHAKDVEGKGITQEFGHAGFVSGLSYSQDGRYLISTGMDGTLRLWEYHQLKKVGVHNYRYKDGRGEAVRPNALSGSSEYGSWLGASGDGGVQAYHDVAGKVVVVRNGYALEEVVASCAVQGKSVGARFSADGTQCFITEDYQRVRGFATDPSIPPTFDIESHGVWQVSQDGRTLLANWNGPFYVWDTETSEIILGPLGLLKGHPLTGEFEPRIPLADGAYSSREIKYPRLSIDGNILAFGHTDKQGIDPQVEIYDLRTGAHTHIDAVFGDLSIIDISDQGNRVVVGSSDTTAKVFSTDTGAAVGPWTRVRGVVANAALSFDGKMLCTLNSWDGLKIWDVETGDLLSAVFKLSSVDLKAPIWFAPDGRSFSLEDNEGTRGTLRLAKHLGPKAHLEKFVQLSSSREMTEDGSVQWLAPDKILNDSEAYLEAWKATTSSQASSAAP